jgi:hypothetical protein
MSAIRIGSPIAYAFECTNQLGVKFDPDLVQVSFVKNHSLDPDESKIEDTLTYLGSEARDSQLTRDGVGEYRFIYIADLVGRWAIMPSWSDDALLAGAQITPRLPIIVDVIATEHQFIDRP